MLFHIETFRIILAAILFFLLDQIWIGWLSREHYSKMISDIQGSPLQIRIWTLPLIYLIIGMAITVYALPKVRQDNGAQNPFLQSLLWGGILGFFGYALFDLTNLAVFQDWRLDLAILDILWGSFLSGVVTYLLWRILG